MADIRNTFVGIRSPNPFWLASAPPTDKAYNVERAFKAGWGGVVWKTLGEDPPVVNVNGPRYATLWSQDRRVIGFNNIELISDRPLQVNLDEIRRVKRDFPDRAMIVSLMVPVNEPSWKAILERVTGAEIGGQSAPAPAAAPNAESVADAAEASDSGQEARRRVEPKLDSVHRNS